jgi:hypothetical protein
MPDLLVSLHPCHGVLYARHVHREAEARRWPREVPEPDETARRVER